MIIFIALIKSSIVAVRVKFLFAFGMKPFLRLAKLNSIGFYAVVGVPKSLHLLIFNFDSSLNQTFWPPTTLPEKSAAARVPKPAIN